jgi:hypothetical protein
MLVLRFATLCCALRLSFVPPELRYDAYFPPPPPSCFLLIFADHCGDWGLCQNVLGEKGRRIRELTVLVQKRFGFADGAVELYAERIFNRGLCAAAQCESLRYKLLGGLAVRRCVWCLENSRTRNQLGNYNL